MTWLTNITITRLIEHIVAIVGNTVEGIINVDYKAIIEVLIEVYFKVITRRNAMFVSVTGRRQWLQNVYIQGVYKTLYDQS